MNPIVQTIISTVITQVAGGNPQQAQLIKSVASMFMGGQQTGTTTGTTATAAAAPGLAGLVQQFQNNGMDDVIGSWIGTGANQPVTGAQVQQALGTEQVQQLAAQAGVPAAEAPNMLAQILPELINRMTPGGKVDNNMVSQILGGLMQQKNAA